MNTTTSPDSKGRFFKISLTVLLSGILAINVYCQHPLDSISYTKLNECISDTGSKHCPFRDLSQNIFTFDTMSNGNFLVIHPYSRSEEGNMIYDVLVDTNSNETLYYSISGHPRGDFHARISITDEQGNQDFILDSIIGAGWIEDSISISNYECQKIRIKFHAASDNGQWSFEYAGIDYFYVAESTDSLSCIDTTLVPTDTSLLNSGLDTSNLKEIELLVFPNPTKEEILIQLNNELLAICKLYDLQGKLVYEEKFISLLKIQTINLAKGVYIVRVNNCGEIIHDRFIKL